MAISSINPYYYFSKLVSPQNSPIIEDLIEKFPDLKGLYEMDAGVSEGYTVGQHTELVLQEAEKFEASFRSKVERLIPWDKFLIFLALHDIGTGPAKEQTKDATPFTSKTVELEKTCEIIREYMPQLGFDDEEVSICLGLLRYDTIGLYLKGDISKDEAFRDMVEISCDIGISRDKIVTFLDTMVAFHSLDAASYPGLKSNVFNVVGNALSYKPSAQNKINGLYNDVEGSVIGERALAVLANNLHVSGTTYNEISDLLIQNAEELQSFLKRTNMELLRKDPSDQLREEYAVIIEQFKDLFLYLGHNSNLDISSAVNKYAKWIKDYKYQSGERSMPFDQLFVSSILKAKGLSNSNHILGNLVLLFPLILSLKENYYTRYGDPSEPESDQRSLLGENPITWLHGSKFNALKSIMASTGGYAIPTGRLLKNGLVPLTGELRDGVSFFGANQFNLSGVGLADSEIAISYSRESDFEINLEEIKSELEKFLEKNIDIGKKVDYQSWQNFEEFTASRLTRIGIIAKQLQVLDKDYFNENLSKINEFIEKYQKIWDKYKSSNYTGPNSYKFAVSEDYYLDGFLLFESSLEQVTAILESFKSDSHPRGSLVPREDENFPVVFGSSTLFAFERRNPLQEIEVSKAKLGADIQSLFTDKDSVGRLEEWVGNSPLKGRVQVLSFEELNNLTNDAKLIKECCRQFFGTPENLEQALKSNLTTNHSLQKLENPVYERRSFTSAYNEMKLRIIGGKTKKTQTARMILDKIFTLAESAFSMGIKHNLRKS